MFTYIERISEESPSSGRKEELTTVLHHDAVTGYLSVIEKVFFSTFTTNMIMFLKLQVLCNCIDATDAIKNLKRTFICR